MGQSLTLQGSRCSIQLRSSYLAMNGQNLAAALGITYSSGLFGPNTAVWSFGTSKEGWAGAWTNLGNLGTFSVSVSPMAQSITYPQQIAYTISYASLYGFNATINLLVAAETGTSLPANCSPPVIYPGTVSGTGQTPMTITPNAPLNPGQYALKVWGDKRRSQRLCAQCHG